MRNYLEVMLETEQGTKDLLRLVLATYILGQMIPTGGLKEDKVKAAFEYADLLMKG